MSASRSWGVKPYRVFPPSCRYRQWPPPQIAVPGPLRLPMILLAFRSHPVDCFPPKGRVQGASIIAASRVGIRFPSHRGRFQGTTGTATRPPQTSFYPTKEGFKGGGTGISSGCSSEVSIPLGHGARWQIHSPILCRSLTSIRGIVAALSTQRVCSLGYKP